MQREDNRGEPLSLDPECGEPESRGAATARFERAADAAASEPYQLRLSVVGMSPYSASAVRMVMTFCDALLHGPCALEVVDIALVPRRAVRGLIVAPPTLARERPLPMRRMIGRLDCRERSRAMLVVPHGV